MRIVGLLSNLPYVSNGASLGCEPEILFADQVDHFVGGQKVASVEVDPAAPLPDDDLSHRESGYYLRAVLDQAALDTPLVVVEDSPCGLQDAHHVRRKQR